MALVSDDIPYNTYICFVADEILTEANVYTEAHASAPIIKNQDHTTELSKNTKTDARTSTLSTSTTIITSTPALVLIKQPTTNILNTVNRTHIVNILPTRSTMRKSTTKQIVKPFTNRPISTTSSTANTTYRSRISTMLKSTHTSLKPIPPKSSLLFSQIVIIALFIGGILIIASIFVWKTCIRMCWFKFRNNPLDYKTKYYCKKSANSIHKGEEEDDIMPTNGHTLVDTAKAKYQSQTADEYSDVRFLTIDDDRIDFTLQEG